MTRLGNLSGATVAVEAISSDIAILEKLAVSGGDLSWDDLALLAHCNDRLTQLLPALAAACGSAGNTVVISGRRKSRVGGSDVLVSQRG